MENVTSIGNAAKHRQRMKIVSSACTSGAWPVSANSGPASGTPNRKTTHAAAASTRQAPPPPRGPGSTPGGAAPPGFFPGTPKKVNKGSPQATGNVLVGGAGFRGPPGWHPGGTGGP